MKQRHFHAALLTSLVLAFSLPRTAAFDTGYHFDLTRDILLVEGFDQPAIEYAQVFNYFNDGFESAIKVIEKTESLFPVSSTVWATIWGPQTNRDISDHQMHFDEMTGYPDVTNRWTKLIHNAYAAARHAETENDVLGFLTVLGMTTHQVQDFTRTPTGRNRIGRVWPPGLMCPRRSGAMWIFIATANLA
jgi:hypothetical protein